MTIKKKSMAARTHGASSMGNAGPEARHIMAQEWHFWRGTKKISHVGHTETSEVLPFLMQGGCSVMVIMSPGKLQRIPSTKTRAELKR
jgi:hypothetical protein